jgi:hypothetical protein
MQNARITITAHDTRRVAVEAQCDTRSVAAYLDPNKRERMKGVTALRVRQALEKLGIAVEVVAS